MTTANKKSNKHEANSALTRDLLITAAQRLYADRGIQSVSFNEITTAAGQKNRNALQYHFGNKNGLLQAIVDRHVSIIYPARQHFITTIKTSKYSHAEIAARALIVPIVDYVSEHSDGVDYIIINSQLAVANISHAQIQSVDQPSSPTESLKLHLLHDSEFAELINNALKHLKPIEAKRRIFLAISIVFNGLADSYRSSAAANAPKYLNDHDKMVEQLILCVTQLFAADGIQ